MGGRTMEGGRAPRCGRLCCGLWRRLVAADEEFEGSLSIRGDDCLSVGIRLLGKRVGVPVGPNVVFLIIGRVVLVPSALSCGCGSLWLLLLPALVLGLAHEGVEAS